MSECWGLGVGGWGGGGRGEEFKISLNLLYYILFFVFG